MSKEIKIITLKCFQCSHIWAPRKSVIVRCAKCKSKKWNNSKKNKTSNRVI